MVLKRTKDSKKIRFRLLNFTSLPLLLNSIFKALNRDHAPATFQRPACFELANIPDVYA